MSRNFDGALVMPKGHSVMNRDEMTYVEGGADPLPYRWSYASTGGAMVKSISYINHMGWNMLYAYDLAAEIYCHAMAYYCGSAFLSMCSALGYSATKIKDSSFWKSVSNGIDLENGLDKKILCGVERYRIFRAVYSVAT